MLFVLCAVASSDSIGFSCCLSHYLWRFWCQWVDGNKESLHWSTTSDLVPIAFIWHTIGSEVVRIGSGGMSAGIGGCCGTKKQKLSNNCCAITLNPNQLDLNHVCATDAFNACNGMPNGMANGMSNGMTNGMPNGMPHGLTNGLVSLRNNSMVVSSDMCFFCFDVLSSHLNQMEPPKTPNFPNDNLWVYSTCSIW